MRDQVWTKEQQIITYKQLKTIQLDRNMYLNDNLEPFIYFQKLLKKI